MGTSFRKTNVLFDVKLKTFLFNCSPVKPLLGRILYLEMRFVEFLQLLGEGSPSSVWGMVEQVWHLSWTEKGNPCRRGVARKYKEGGREWREVRPLRRNVIFWSSVPYRHTLTRAHTGKLCRVVGDALMQRRMSAWGIKINIEILMCAFVCLPLHMLCVHAY